MLVAIERSRGLVVIPKAASNSIMNALAGRSWEEVTALEFSCLPDRRAFIRDPYERAASAYRMYARDGSGKHKYDLSTFERFVLSACALNGNDPHVMPQMRLCAPKGTLLANSIVRWDFDELSKFIGAPIAHDNRGERTRSTDWTVAARTMFDEVYAEDLQLWKGDRCPG